jgi:hypothetical protein
MGNDEEPARVRQTARFCASLVFPVRLESIKLSGFRSFAEPTNFMLPGKPRRANRLRTRWRT